MQQVLVLRRFLRHVPLPGMPAPRTLHLQKSSSLPFPRGMCSLCPRHFGETSLEGIGDVPVSVQFIQTFHLFLKIVVERAAESPAAHWEYVCCEYVCNHTCVIS